jgi:hypothetical protein
MKFANATKFNRKSGEAEGSAVLLMDTECKCHKLIVIPTVAKRSGGTCC